MIQAKPYEPFRQLVYSEQQRNGREEDLPPVLNLGERGNSDNSQNGAADEASGG